MYCCGILLLSSVYTTWVKYKPDIFAQDDQNYWMTTINQHNTVIPKLENRATNV